jgi:hypothetical protein
MDPVLKRARPESCLSDLRLDRLVAAELDAPAEADARAHLSGCAPCAARLAEIEAGRAAFLADPPPLRAVAPGGALLADPRPSAAARLVSVRRIRAWAPPLTAALALAAAGLLWLRSPGPVTDPLDPGTRIKGHARVGFYVKYGAAVTPGAAGETVLAGDTLQFTTTTPRDGAYFALIAVDGARKASVYYPAGPRAAPIDHGRDVPLGASTVLDDVLGDETAYAFFCAEPIALEPLRAAVERAPEHPPVPASCELDRVSYVKRAPR